MLKTHILNTKFTKYNNVKFICYYIYIIIILNSYEFKYNMNGIVVLTTII